MIMMFNTKLREIINKKNNSKSIVFTIPAPIVDAYKINKGDLVTISFQLEKKNIDFTNRTYLVNNTIVLTIPKHTVNKYILEKDMLLTFDVMKVWRD